MSHTAFFLVILAGLIHALWNIAAKKAGGDVRFAGFTSLIMMLVWAPVGIYAGWNVVPTWGWLEWGFVTASGILHVLYFITLLRGYRKAELTVVYPLARGFGPLLSSTAAILFLGEKVSLTGGLGIIAVVGGVFLIAGGPKLFRSVSDHVQHVRVRKGIVYGLLTGLFIAAYTVLDGYAVKVMLISPILIDYVGNFIRIALLAPALLRDRQATRASWNREWKYALIVGTISPVSYMLVLYAMQNAPLSHVAPAREVSMLFAALIGGHLLGEGDRVQRIIGALCIAAGVIALGNF
ncbi:EamA family transporter [Undibacterium sp. RuTC16W]|uniref:DMT family transporter n=1 Tax=Undibacterium sp. RuTC16W TaxID=3413048 RepID=UPI003BF0B0CE